MVGDDFNITGIIDWGLHLRGPRHWPFSSSCMLWPVGDLYEGKNGIAPEEIKLATMFEKRSREDMAANVRESRRTQRFCFFNGGGVRSFVQWIRAPWAGDHQQLSSY